MWAVKAKLTTFNEICLYCISQISNLYSNCCSCVTPYWHSNSSSSRYTVKRETPNLSLNSCNKIWLENKGTWSGQAPRKLKVYLRNAAKPVACSLRIIHSSARPNDFHILTPSLHTVNAIATYGGSSYTARLQISLQSPLNLSFSISLPCITVPNISIWHNRKPGWSPRISTHRIKWKHVSSLFQSHSFPTHPSTV